MQPDTVLEAPPRDRLIRREIVEALTGCKKSHLYALMRLKENSFPKNIRISGRYSVWSETAVLRWIQQQVEAGGVTDGGRSK